MFKVSHLNKILIEEGLKTAGNRRVWNPHTDDPRVNPELDLSSIIDYYKSFLIRSRGGYVLQAHHPDATAQDIGNLSGLIKMLEEGRRGKAKVFADKLDRRWPGFVDNPTWSYILDGRLASTKEAGKPLSELTDDQLARRERRLSQNLRDIRKELKGADAKEKKELLEEKKDLEARLKKVDAEMDSREKKGKKAGQALELLDNLGNQKALNRAWPNITYKGTPLHSMSRGYPFQSVADQQVTYDEFQEVYMGYVPDKDLFVVGYDVWLPEDDWEEEDWDEDEEWGALPGGGYRAASSRKKADMEAQAVVIKFDGQRARATDVIYGPGGFYGRGGGYKAVKRKFPNIIDLRLD